jgi:peptidoglycan/LPS O-acetylase OafA/YrhL
MLPGVLGWFSLGMALAVGSVAVRVKRPAPAPLRFAARAPTLMWLGAFALWFGGIVLGVFPDFPDAYGGPQWLVAQAVYGFIVVLLLAPAVFGDDRGGAVRGVLGNRFLSWLGLISYGLFLWHTTILDELGESGALDDVPGLALVALGFAITVACAAASYYIVERPLLRLKYGQRRRRARRPVAAGVGAAGGSD